MKVANVDYPPNGVANFAIMLMLISLRKGRRRHILKRGEDAGLLPAEKNSAAIFPPALWV
ncbi:hypothetical protein ACKXF4_16510 [Faecalibacterium prausnitzii]|uniref:hypothetical protein n=1 Tax=Faecalibacterium prausnitzii TaxID=853 RepID=UPI003AAAAA42